MTAGTVDPAHDVTSLQPSAQYVPQAGQTHTRWRRSIVHVQETERSDGLPGPSSVHRCPFGQAGGGINW